MRWFNLSIEQYRNGLFNQHKSRLSAISVIKYPIYFIQATIKKYADDDTQSLDYQILKIINYFKVTNEKNINLILGVMEGVVRWRIESLESSGFLIVSDHKIELTDDGFELLNRPDQRIIITTTENFYIDGVTLKPLTSEFYQKHYKFGQIHTFIEHGDRDFETDIVHTPPSDNIIENIIDIPIDKRVEYSIPQSLIEIVAIDPVRMMHPLGVVYTYNEKHEINKRLIDCCDSLPRNGILEGQQDLLQGRIDNLFIQPDIRNSKQKDIIQFGTSWDFQESSENDSIFKISLERLKKIIFKEYNIEILQDDDMQINNDYICWKINKKYFKHGYDNNEMLIEYLKKGQHFIHQHEHTGVWIVYIEFTPNDQFVEDLLKVTDIIDKNNYNLEQLIVEFGLKYLRSLLISLGKYFVLEDLDSDLYLSKFVSGNYSKPNIYDGS